MFRFVSDSTSGVGTKRKYSHRSCATCKRRHKRCAHSADDPKSQSRTHTSPEPLVIAERESPIPASNRAQQRHQDAAPAKQQSSTGAYLRFVGDLSPEASFLASKTREDGQQKRRAEVGVWLGQRPEDVSSTGEQDTIQIEPTSSPPFKLVGLSGLKAIYPYIHRECMTVKPPDYEFGLIFNLYYAKIDPIFPILHREDLEKHSPADTAALKQAICLIAALDPSLRTHLRLPHTEAVLTPVEFRSCIATALKHALDAGFIRDKMVLLQVTTIMALYVDKPSSSDFSSHYVAQAVELSQTLGLHLGWPSEEGSTAKSSRIFWCIWSLDRLNAATNGRPILIHDRDMDKRILNSVDEQLPAFRLLIRISKYLDETISQYRPAAALESDSTGGEKPSFEDLVLETRATGVSSPLLGKSRSFQWFCAFLITRNLTLPPASLELFYLAVLILKNRPKERGSPQARNPSSNLQTFSAASIVAIASEEFKTSMTFWGVVPYAVSLATSVAYQNLRNSTLTHRRKQAYTTFYSSCDILDELSKYFLSARTNARLARDTLQEVERASVGRSKNRQSDHPSSNTRTAQNSPGVSGRSSTSFAEREQSTANIQSALSASSQPAHRTTFPSHSAGQTQESSTEDGALVDMDFADVAGLFDNVDLDLGFHLNRMDAIFSANLNPTMPFFPEQWIDDSLHHTSENDHA